MNADVGSFHQFIDMALGIGGLASAVCMPFVVIHLSRRDTADQERAKAEKERDEKIGVLSGRVGNIETFLKATCGYDPI